VFDIAPRENPLAAGLIVSLILAAGAEVALELIAC